MSAASRWSLRVSAMCGCGTRSPMSRCTTRTAGWRRTPSRECRLADFVRRGQVYGNRQSGPRGRAEFGGDRRYGGRYGDGANEFRNVDLRGVKGGARVTAGNAAIRMAVIGGEVYAKTSFAGVAVEDAGGPVTVENGNGSVTVAAKAGAGVQTDRDPDQLRADSRRCARGRGIHGHGKDLLRANSIRAGDDGERRDCGGYDQRKNRGRRVRNAPHQSERQHRYCQEVSEAASPDGNDMLI